MRRPIPFLLVTTLLGTIGLSAMSVSPVRPDEPNAELKAKVKQLIDQLGDADSEKQTAAATALLKLGPDILPLLPDNDPKLTAMQVRQLQSIRGTLRDALAQKELVPRTVTIQENAIPLSKALAELAKQTGMEVEDHRQNKDDDPKLKLDLNKTIFWQAVDSIAKEADLRVMLNHREHRVSLMDGPHQIVAVCYSGIFRISLKRLSCEADSEADTHQCRADLLIAWEPRFQPLFLESKPETLDVQDDKGMTLKLVETGSGKIAVNGKLGIELPVRLEAPPRNVARLGQLKGTLAIIGPTKMLTFTFDKLAKIEKGKDDQALKTTKEGVTVKIHEFTPDAELWSVGVSLDYPDDSPDFESFESWLVNNQIELVKKDGKAHLEENGGYEIDDQAGHRAILTYRFVEKDNVALGKPGDWNLVYRTPGAITKIPVKFEFKDLQLP